MKKVFVPVDFSGQSISAFRFALDIAAKSHGSVHLLHAISLPVLHDSPFFVAESFRRPLYDELKEVAHQKFEKILQAFNKTNTPITTEVVISGSIHRVLLESVQKAKADLVVMGTRGASGLREWVIGSNTEKFVRAARVPVIAVKKYIGSQSIRNIVFPNILDVEDQEDLIMKIKALQHFFNATLHIIWVNTPTVFKPDQEVRQQMKAFAERFMLANYTINVFNYTNEESGIIEFTNQIKGDLIAMGTSGLTGLAHMVAGSVAEDVVNHAQYLVWTYSTKSSKSITTQNS